MKIPIFREIFLQAWHATIQKKLPWIFGGLIGIVNLFEAHLSFDMPETPDMGALINTITQKTPEEWLWILASLILFLLLGILGRSNLIPALSFVAKKNDLANSPKSLVAIQTNFLRGFRLECLIFLIILSTVALLSLPLWLASMYNPGTVPLLMLLEILTLTPILIILFFVRQYALLYLLLSPVGIRGALETSSSLFLRFLFPSLLFGLFAFTLTLSFTFLLNLVILSITLLFRTLSIPLTEAFLLLPISGFLLSWFAIFQQALWIAFFKNIALTPDTQKTTVEEEAPLVNNKLPDSPPAQ